MEVKMELGLRMVPCHRLELRQTLRLVALSADAPPEAARGAAGLATADEILKRLGVPGLLIGGIARKSWTAKTKSSVFSSKDVDVMVLSFDPWKHPERFEGGVDWWMTNHPDVGPTNGNGVELIYSATPLYPLPPGLHVAPAALLWDWREQEQEAFRGKKMVTNARRPDQIHKTSLVYNYPICLEYKLRSFFTDPSRWA